MQEELLREVFDKARVDSGEESANGLAQHIHQELKKSKQPTTADAIRGFYRKLENNEPFNISKTSRNHLAQYLEMENFQAYLKSKERTQVNSKRHIYLIAILLGIISLFVYDRFSKKCMIWKEDRYVKIHCEEANAKPIDQRLLVNFRKIEGGCETRYFNEAGNPIIWYYKISDTEIECFNRLAEYPINGKALKPITEYMIQKYCCSTYIKEIETCRLRYDLTL